MRLTGKGSYLALCPIIAIIGNGTLHRLQYSTEGFQGIITRAITTAATAAATLLPGLQTQDQTHLGGGI